MVFFLNPKETISREHFIMFNMCEHVYLYLWLTNDTCPFSVERNLNGESDNVAWFKAITNEWSINLVVRLIVSIDAKCTFLVVTPTRYNQKCSSTKIRTARRIPAVTDMRAAVLHFLYFLLGPKYFSRENVPLKICAYSGAGLCLDRTTPLVFSRSLTRCSASSWWHNNFMFCLIYQHTVIVLVS